MLTRSGSGDMNVEHLYNRMKLTADIRKILKMWTTDEGRSNYKHGATIHHVRSMLNHGRWKLPSGENFVSLLVELGFKVNRATTKTGYHKSVRAVSL
jgi:hypothetical protein